MSSCNYNKAIIMGKIKTIPTVRYSQFGEPTAHMYVCTKAPDDDQLPFAGDPWRQSYLKDEWIFVVCRDDLADKVERELDGGDLVRCEGSMSTVKWKDGHGQYHRDYALVAESVDVVVKSAFEVEKAEGGVKPKGSNKKPF